MRRLIAAAAAGLMALSALPAAANAAPQERRYEQDRPGPGHGPDRGPPGHGPDRGGPGHDDRYGRWENSWGVRPAGPPRSWTRQSDWYRHVRACSQRFRSYNPRTDTYVVRRGRTAQCRL